MSRDDMYDLILGAAVVTVGYMLWKQHKAAATKAATPALNQSTAEIVGNWFDIGNLTEGVF